MALISTRVDYNFALSREAKEKLAGPKPSERKGYTIYLYFQCNFHWGEGWVWNYRRKPAKS